MQQAEKHKMHVAKQSKKAFIGTMNVKEVGAA